MEENKFLKAFGINYAGTLPKIKKSNDQLQPIYEALTNSLEALTNSQESKEKGSIIIKLYYRSSLYSKEKNEYDFDKIIVEDTGIGFNDQEFERLENLNDVGKGHFNKGSGRVQFLHFFDKSEYRSVFKDESSRTGFKERIFTLSKSSDYLSHNAIIFYKSLKEVKAERSLTKLTLIKPIIEKDLHFYNDLNCEVLKEQIIAHYLAYFCENRTKLPIIKIQYLIDSNLKTELSIQSEDIPNLDSQKDMVLNYWRFSYDGDGIEKTANKEVLNLKAFKISKDKLSRNGLKLTSKGEIATEIKLDNLMAEDFIDNNRYLFLISGNYINERDTDSRGRLNIPTSEEYKKSSKERDSIFTDEEILLDDIQDTANENILLMYDEIKKKTEEKKDEIDKLQKMFLLNSDTIKEVKIKLNDTEERILEKVYQADAKLVAKNDAEIKKQIDTLKELNTTSEDYYTELEKKVNELVKIIPLQNRTALTHYIARRKLVLELFEKILDNELNIQESTERNINEKLLHNLIFQQSSDSPSDSDLWLINEDFIYFKGSSESKLCDLKINGDDLLRNDLNEKEKQFRKSLNEDRFLKRPDILLFPDEAKCIIIEFKSTDVNVSDHLNQINNYATLIRNFAKPEFQFTTFYGYLIGEKIDPNDVRAYDADYKEAFNFDYLFRPNKTIAGMFGNSDANLYSEVIKYSTLLERSKLRNKIFIEKITKTIIP